MAWNRDLNTAFNKHVSPEPNSGCWLWNGPRLMKRGRYGVFTHRPSGTIMQRAHRISWQLHKGNITEEQHVLHKCDNVLCVNPDHLFLGDQLKNNEDKSYKKRHTFGENHPKYKHGRYVGDKQNPKYWR
jgi:hypothetical protein